MGSGEVMLGETREYQRRVFKLLMEKLKQLAVDRGVSPRKFAMQLHKEFGGFIAEDKEGERPIVNLAQHGSPFDGKEMTLPQWEIDMHVLWAARVAAAYGQDPEGWVLPEDLPRLRSYARWPQGRPVGEGGTVIVMNSPHRVDVEDASKVFDRLRKNLPSNGVYSICGTHPFYQSNRGERLYDVSWRWTEELLSRDVRVEFVASAISAETLASAEVSANEGTLRGFGKLVRYRKAPRAVELALGSENRILVFDSEPTAGTLPRMDQALASVEARSAAVYIGILGKLGDRRHHVWLEMLDRRAAEVLHSLRLARYSDSPHEHGDSLGQEFETWPPLTFSHIQMTQLRANQQVTIITGDRFLESGPHAIADKQVAKRIHAEAKRVREETVECLRRGVRYRYVALPGSRAQGDLAVLHRWVESLAESERDLVDLLVGPETLREFCASSQRVLLFSGTHGSPPPGAWPGLGDVAYGSITPSDSNGSALLSYLKLGVEQTVHFVRELGEAKAWPGAG